MQIDVSIITICRNERSSIESTILSVLSQTHRSYEYLVIDGASTDGTVGVIEQYSDKFAFWSSEPDKGVYEAMNKGIRRAKGDYLFFLNGGDMFAGPTVLERVFTSRKHADILYGDLVKDDAGRRYLCSLAGYSSSPFFFFTHTLPHQATLISRRLFQDYGLYDESYNLMGDYEFFKRVLVKNNASIEYLGFAVGIFDCSGMSTKAEYKTLQKREAIRARLATYGLPRFLALSFIWGLYDLFYYRPRRKILHLLGKS